MSNSYIWLGLLFLIFAPPSLALTPAITNFPSQINSSQEFVVDTFLTQCPSCGNSYLRGVFFYPESSTTYFGFSQNNSAEWIDSSTDRTKYYLVTPDQINTSSWSGQLKFKFDPQKGPGDYYFKIGRYTSSNDSSADWSEKIAINVIGPTPTPLPTAVPSSTPTPKLSPPTSTPKPSVTPKPPTATPQPTLSPTPTPQIQVLNFTTTSLPISSPTPPVIVPSKTEEVPPPAQSPPKPTQPIAAQAVISIGLASMAAGALLYWHSVRSA